MTLRELRGTRTTQFRAIWRLYVPLLLTLGALLALGSQSTAALTTATLQNGSGFSGFEDTFIDWWQQTTTQPTALTINTYGNGLRKGLIRINLPANIKSNAYITSAVLYLRTSNGGDNALIYMHDVSKPWVASQATWSNYASGQTWSSIGMVAKSDYSIIPFDTYGIAKTNDWTSWDILSLVRNNVRAGNNAISVVIMNPSEGINCGAVEFYSSEYTDPTLRPKLVITYDASTPGADAGPDQTYTSWDVSTKARVGLDASRSSDATATEPSLKYDWSFTQKPYGSNLVDSSITPNGVTGSAGADKPSFVPDAYGNYDLKVRVTNTTTGLYNEDSVRIRVVTTPVSHPRAFLTPARMAKLKSLAAANTYEWQHTYKYAQGHTFDAEKQYMKAKGLVYAMKTAPDYMNIGNDAVAAVMAKIATPIHDPLYSTYGVEVVAYAYDWCWDLFTPAQRQQVIAWMNSEADYLKDNYWGTSSWSNYFVRGMYANALAGYVTLGENPEAQSHIDDAAKRWEVVKAGFKLSGDGGGWPEGTGYEGWQAVNLVEFAELIETATGEDIYASPPSMHFFQDRLRYSLFETHPGFLMTGFNNNYPPYARQTVLIGDGRRGVYGNTVEKRISDDMLVDHYYGKDPAAQSLQWFLTRPPADHMPYDEYMVDEFMYFDSTRTATAPTGLAHYAPGVGEALFRSDWDPSEKATMVTFKSCGQYEGHQHLDANSFTIWKQGDLALDSCEMDNDIGGNWSINFDRRSIAHNTMLIYNPNEVFRGFYQMSTGKNDGGQRTMEPSSFSGSVDYWDAYPYIFDKARTTRFDDNSVYSYVMGDATNAYNSPRYCTPGNVPKVTNFTRQLVYLRPTALGADDAVVVYDRVSSADASFQKKWLLHTHTMPNVNGAETKIDDHEYTYTGDTFQADSGHIGTSGDGDGRLFGKVLLPKAHLIRKLGGQAKVTSMIAAPTNKGNGKISPEIGACNVAQTWTMTFTSPTTYTLTSSVTGVNCTGNTSSEVWTPTNYELCFRGSDFTGTFATGDKFTFTLDQGKDFWVFGSNNSPTGSFEPKYGQWRVEVEPTVPAKDDVFLHVLYPTVNTTLTMPTATLVEASTGNMYGAQVALRNGTQTATRVVMFSSKGEAPLNEPISYTVTGSGTSRQILMDMAPNTSFTVNAGGANFQALSNSAGSLAFDVNLSGATQVSINGGGGSGPPPPPPGSPSISLNKVADKANAKPNDTVSYTISYTNVGGANAANLVITDTLPGSATYVVGSARLNGAAITPDPVSGGVMRVNVGTVAPNGSGLITFQVKVK